MLPTAIIIGPMKAGTTWIYRYLRMRGDVVLPHKVKETFFFDRNYDRGLSWYKSHFSTHNALANAVVEVAPSYFHSHDAPARIVLSLGRIPVITVLRNPVRRAFSHYLHQRRYGFTTAPLVEAVLDYPEIVDASRYALQLERWFEHFSREQVLVLFQEDLSAAPDRFVSAICKHLELPFITPPEELNRRVNEAALPPNPGLAAAGQAVADRLRSLGLYWVINWAKRIGLKRLFFGKPGQIPLPELTTEERQFLADQLWPDVERLEGLLGKDLSHWRR